MTKVQFLASLMIRVDEEHIFNNVIVDIVHLIESIIYD